MTDKRRLYYWGHEHPNWGDNISPLLYQLITGKESVNCIHEDNRLVMIGSLMHVIRPGDVIWGTGMLSPSHISNNIEKCDIKAVRGPLSRWAINKKYPSLNVPEIYGDPALLLADYIDVKSFEGANSKDICIIPHYDDYEHCKTNLSDIDVLDIRNRNVIDFMKLVNKYKVVLSSSLHGLILADVLSKSSCHIMASSKLTGLSFKFRDYYESTGRNHKNHVIDFRGGFKIDEAVEISYNALQEFKFDKQKLMDSFPG